MAAAGLRPYAHDCRMLPHARLFTTATRPSLTAGPPACSLCPSRTTTAWITSRRGLLKRSERWLLPALRLLGWDVQRRRPGQPWWSEQACAWPSSLMQAGMGWVLCGVAWLLGWVLCCAACMLGAVWRGCWVERPLCMCVPLSISHAPGTYLGSMPWRLQLPRACLLPTRVPTPAPGNPTPDHFAAWAATDQRPGINFIDPEDYSPAVLRQQLSAAREAGADLVVVFIHWWVGQRVDMQASVCAIGGWTMRGMWTNLWRYGGLWAFSMQPAVCGCVQATCGFDTVARPAQIRVQGAQLEVAALHGDTAPGPRLCRSGGRRCVRTQVALPSHDCVACFAYCGGERCRVQACTAADVPLTWGPRCTRCAARTTSKASRWTRARPSSTAQVNGAPVADRQRPAAAAAGFTAACACRCLLEL